MKRKLIITVAFTSALLLAGACRKQTTEPQRTVAGTPTPAAQDAPAGGAAQAGDKYFFRGTIAGLWIEMQLLRDGERLSGTYFYPKIGKNIALSGTVDKDNNVTLTETDDSGKQTGVFKGKWQTASDAPDTSIHEIEGKWSRPDGSKQTEFIITQQPYEFTGNVQVNAKLIKEANKQKHYTIDGQYPQIDGDARFDGFNREAKSMITKDVAAFRTGENSEDANDVAGVTDENQNSTMDVGYDFRYATDNLVSISFTEATYERGAAHGNSSTQVINYDVKNNKKLALADLFKDKSKYLNVIAAYCQKEFKERAKKPDALVLPDQIESGAGPRADNYRAWNITKQGLWITFDPYQVAAYAAGPQYVLVPYSVLKDIIKPDGPIGAYAQ
ncbi:MAG TPA: RsiV family protein [Pyrinomonadaceae bacterium]|nr:RsiV family protein [Pyrinomonadaceae bacterium]